MKGFLEQKEFKQLLKSDIFLFKNREKTQGIEALRLFLVEGITMNQAMKRTGVHRDKIAKAKNRLLKKWREQIANDSFN